MILDLNAVMDNSGMSNIAIVAGGNLQRQNIIISKRPFVQWYGSVLNSNLYISC